MDPDRFFTSVCVMMVCLIGTTLLASADNCPCPKIPKRKFTLPEDLCFQSNSKYRYKCIPGYVRKAGTSNLIKCEYKNGVLQWTTSHLECIPHPDPPSTTADVPDGLAITTEAPSWPDTSPSHPRERTSTYEATSSDIMEQTTSGTKSTTPVVSYTLLSSTHSTSSCNNDPLSVTEAYTAVPQTVGITLSVVIVLFVMSGIIFLLHRRRKRPIPSQQTEEMLPMNKSV
ncbi:interleukin-15 receptor subunit alpha [Anableps anableps]